MNILRAWIDFLKRQNKPAENSVSLRVTVAALVLVALGSAAAQLEWPDYCLAAMVLSLSGFAFSYRYRHRNNWELKAVLSVLMVVTLLHFFGNLARTMYDPRIPLAELIIWLQTLHSWDVPARRDLNYSAVVGLILMALSAVLSHDMKYGLFLAVFLSLGLVTLHLNHMAGLQEETGSVPARRASVQGLMGLLGRQARIGVVTILVGVVVFLMLPRTQGMRLRTLPVSWQMRQFLTRISEGEVMNPSYPSRAGRDPWDDPLPFSPDNYVGFNAVVDLNSRGRLNSDVVMKVRTTRWSYYRGMAFDHYQGRYWSLSEPDLEEIANASPPLSLPFVSRGTRENVQIYYIERALPNIVFAAPTARQLFFPSEEVYLDTEGGIRSPFALEEGMVYSVISYESDLSLREVMRLPDRDPHLLKLDRYLQLPPALPGRVKALARELVEGRDSTYEKAAAISIYLKENFRYELEPPAYPNDADTADFFLFEAKEGYCEQYATAMAVLCRSAGIHARYATGYLPGTYNPLTGFYEVRGDLAHAWVEVVIPNLGWVTFDPTPAAPISPDLEPQAADRWLVVSVFRYLAEKLGLERFDLGAWLQSLCNYWAATLRGLGIPPGPALGGLLALTMGGVLLLVIRRLGWRGKGVLWGKPRALTPRERVCREYTLAAAALSRAGRARQGGETPREYNRRLQAQSQFIPELADLTALFEDARYSPHPVSEALVQRAQGLRMALEATVHRLPATV